MECTVTYKYTRIYAYVKIVLIKRNIGYGKSHGMLYNGGCAMGAMNDEI